MLNDGAHRNFAAWRSVACSFQVQGLSKRRSSVLCDIQDSEASYPIVACSNGLPQKDVDDGGSGRFFQHRPCWWSNPNSKVFSLSWHLRRRSRGKHPRVVDSPLQEYRYFSAREKLVKCSFDR